MAVDDTVSPPQRTTVKLLVRSAELASAARWLESVGGQLVSAPPDGGASGQVVVLAGLPVSTLSDLDGQPWLLRAEAPKEMFARMDWTRGPATGLDAA